jgi:DNA polymerase II large subunit
VRKALQRCKALVAHTIYECGGCGERFLGERRCGDCNVFARAVGLGGACPECDTPVLLDDLLGEGVVPTI